MEQAIRMDMIGESPMQETKTGGGTLVSPTTVIQPKTQTPS